MKKFLFGVFVGVMLTSLAGGFAIVKHQRASAAEQAARAAVAQMEAAQALPH